MHLLIVFLAMIFHFQNLVPNSSLELIEGTQLIFIQSKFMNRCIFKGDLNVSRRLIRILIIKYYEHPFLANNFRKLRHE